MLPSVALLSRSRGLDALRVSNNDVRRVFELITVLRVTDEFRLVGDLQVPLWVPATPLRGDVRSETATPILGGDVAVRPRLILAAQILLVNVHNPVGVIKPDVGVVSALQLVSDADRPGLTVLISEVLSGDDDRPVDDIVYVIDGSVLRNAVFFAFRQHVRHHAAARDSNGERFTARYGVELPIRARGLTEPHIQADRASHTVLIDVPVEGANQGSFLHFARPSLLTRNAERQLVGGRQDLCREVDGHCLALLNGAVCRPREAEAHTVTRVELLVNRLTVLGDRRLPEGHRRRVSILRLRARHKIEHGSCNEQSKCRHYGNQSPEQASNLHAALLIFQGSLPIVICNLARDPDIFRENRFTSSGTRTEPTWPPPPVPRRYTA